MKKWEYKTINQKSRINLSQLNELGSEGWELVNTISVPNTGSYTLIFKRELEDAEGDGWNYSDAFPKQLYTI